MDINKITQFHYEKFMESIDDLELLVNNIKNNKENIKKYIDNLVKKNNIDEFLYLKNLINNQINNIEEIYLTTKNYYFITDQKIKEKTKELEYQEHIMKDVKKILPYIMLLSS